MGYITLCKATDKRQGSYHCLLLQRNKMIVQLKYIMMMMMMMMIVNKKTFQH
jgi:hypothetical protein